MQHIKIIVSGLVQGVGYRYFCYKNALSLGVKGYVKNLYNGDVELKAEAEEGILKDFVNILKTGSLHSNVKSVNVESLPYEGKYTEFYIL